MNLFEKLDLNPGKIAKIFGVAFLGLVLVIFSFGLINSVLRSVSGDRQYVSQTTGLGGSSISTKNIMESASDSILSTRNIVNYDNEFTPGMDVEEFEVTEYRATIETRSLDESCGTILSLKEKEYVIFETSNNSDNNCNFRFKVKKDNVEEVLAIVNSLDPRDLNESVQSIKKQIEDFTSEEDVLKRKLETIDDTLSSAIVSYDEISKLATQTRDATSLASIIDSKIKIIERLSQEKINTSAQLEKLSRMKAEQLDRLEYTYFNVSIYENKYVDVDQLKDSWKNSIKSFVREMNGVAQDLSIGLITLIAFTFQYLLYLLIIVLVAKFVWLAFKRLWNR
ncbi:MAG: hypothetical protein PF572_04485 [Patescibacteria group bacterium]|jgi:hypothetical protein|nr:hypothetical protein [Patescibacteria group bacterium]